MHKMKNPGGAQALRVQEQQMSPLCVGTNPQEDKALTDESQEVDWDAEAKRLERKTKKFFKGFSSGGQSQAYQEAVHEMHNISGSAFKCLCFIVRQTIGWQKPVDCISLNQFSKGIISKSRAYFLGVGLSRKSISKALKELKGTGYIVKRVLCPWCSTDVPQIAKKVKAKNGKEHTRLQVHARCPHCQKALRGKEKIYYGLRFKVEVEGVGENLPKGSAQKDTGVGENFPKGRGNKGTGVGENVHSQVLKQLEKTIINSDDDISLREDKRNKPSLTPGLRETIEDIRKIKIEPDRQRRQSP